MPKGSDSAMPDEAEWNRTDEELEAEEEEVELEVEVAEEELELSLLPVAAEPGTPFRAPLFAEESPF